MDVAPASSAPPADTAPTSNGDPAANPTAATNLNGPTYAAATDLHGSAVSRRACNANATAAGVSDAAGDAR